MSDAGMSDASVAQAQELLRSGRFSEAAASFREIVRKNPQHIGALQALSVTYFQTGQFELAQYFAGEALRLDPSFLDGFRIRGMALMQLKRYPAALECFERALSLNPDFVEVIANRATVLLELKRFDEALAGYDRVVALNPGNAIGWNNRANALVGLRRLEEAVECYDRALAIKPDLTPAINNRFLVLLQLRKLNRIPDFALRAMFDEVATRFDHLMVDELVYRGHQHVRALADRVLPRREHPWRILDLGCGTGLVGETFKDLAAGGRLDGIDLAPRMIEEARKRSVYNDLILGDLESVLAEDGPNYDLIVSADTMVYLGDLMPTFRGVSKRLEAGGYFIFICEAKNGAGWEQTSANRFRHSVSYVREEAERAGLSFVDIMDCTIRYESADAVAGHTVALVRSK